MKKIIVTVFFMLIFFVTGCAGDIPANLQNSSSGHTNSEQPQPLLLNRGQLTAFPAYDKYSDKAFQVDLRSYDLTALNLMTKYNDLIHADFDTKTVWPYALPGKFDPKNIMEYGKDPGLNIKKLHARGITGQNVGIAIIGPPLLTGHIEYSGRLKVYQKINQSGNEPASATAGLMASVAAGKTTGVAPGADLYYITEAHETVTEKGTERNMFWVAKAIDRVIEINKTLKKGHKIQVLAMGFGWSENDIGYRDVADAVNKAIANDIFVISSSLYETYSHEIYFNGLGRSPLRDPDRADSYGPGISWAGSFFMFGRYTPTLEALLVPMDSKTAASPTGYKDYAFYSQNNFSVCAAFIAGLYALARQTDSDITPLHFWEQALKTGEIIDIENPNIDHLYKLRKIVNPVKLIESIK